MKKFSKNKLVHWFIIVTFVLLYVIVSLISMIHVIDFFKLSNSHGLSIALAIAFEIGAAASLASIIVIDKMKRGIVWSLFILLTLIQMMGNTFYAFMHLSNYNGWIQLFGIQDFDPIMQKRILAIISGAILPLIALGFIKALVDYIKPANILQNNSHDLVHVLDQSNSNDDIINEDKKIEDKKIEDKKIIKDPLEDIQDPKFKEVANEYINKTKLDSTAHPKTTPGIG